MPRRDGIFALLATGVVLVAVVIGFLNLGSPSGQRQAAADRARVDDLRSVAGELHTRWKNELPSSLGKLGAAPGGRPLRITDPVTKQPYEYRLREGTVYEICATFATDSHRPDGAPSFWDHPKGHHCYVLDSIRRPE